MDPRLRGGDVRQLMHRHARGSACVPAGSIHLASQYVLADFATALDPPASVLAFWGKRRYNENGGK